MHAPCDSVFITYSTNPLLKGIHIPPLDQEKEKKRLHW